MILSQLNCSGPMRSGRLGGFKGDCKAGIRSGRSLVSPAAQAVRTLRQSYDYASGSRRKTRTLANGSNPQKPRFYR
jgi:hypothetical protein